MTPRRDPDARPRLVFLIGAPRSGTTWLQSLLGSHPAVVTPQETDLFDTYIAPLQRQWDEQAERSDAEQKQRRTKGLPAVLGEAEFHALVAGFVDGVFANIAALDPQASVIVEKSPMHSRHTALIERYLPDASFIHIVRDGRDVVSSLLSAEKTWGSYWADGGVRRWSGSWKAAVVGARKAAGTGRYVELRYEDLRAGDADALRAAFAMCGLDVSHDDCAARLEEFSLERMAEGSAPSPIRLGGEMARRHGSYQEPDGFFGRGLVGGWRDTWTARDKLVFDAVAGDLLVALGYEPDRSWSGSAASHRRFRAAVRIRRTVNRALRRVGAHADQRLRALP
jgi:LPS sulfotransferase NodH